MRHTGNDWSDVVAPVVTSVVMLSEGLGTLRALTGFKEGGIQVRMFRVVGRVLCAAVFGIALLAACSNGSSTGSKPVKPSAPPFDGPYRFDFDGNQQLAGGAPKPTKSRTRTYAVRSTCTDSGCIASATKLDDNNSKQKSTPPLDLVLDYVDGHWQMTLREDTACADSDVKGTSLTAWILQPQAD